MNRQIRKVNDCVSEIKSDTLDSERERLAHYDSVIRKLFYACEYCDGALIHLANCIACKRATIRKCTHCNTEMRITHTMCETSGRFENHRIDSVLGAEKQ
ncbi:hypothetical protein [Candidatus Nitrosotenuis sp. DW1]|uniref:hypothetical protein n=1 Tax=Candidatus Nitrosotenuis sp. DW1 TaxID=2259672 RepID=UPI0015CA9808|nr:hypothetical protein [Candidatus Nitrosotenuis sp. DW1]